MYMESLIKDFGSVLIDMLQKVGGEPVIDEIHGNHTLMTIMALGNNRWKMDNLTGTITDTEKIYRESNTSVIGYYSFITGYLAAHPATAEAFKQFSAEVSARSHALEELYPDTLTDAEIAKREKEEDILNIALPNTHPSMMDILSSMIDKDDEE